MAITARIFEGGSVVLVSDSVFPLPEPSAVFAHFGSASASGAALIDDTALRMRTFRFSSPMIQVVFEPTRIRIDLLVPKKPHELNLGELIAKLVAALYPKHTFSRYGFNYDITYQFDTVIPQREVMGAFMEKDSLEAMTHFGWQCSFLKERGARRETYFFKVISPLEIRVMSNIEFGTVFVTAGDQSMDEYKRCYTESQDIIKHLAFSYHDSYA